MNPKPPLPQILLIDDQYGRRELGKAFRTSVGEEFFCLYQADQENLLNKFGLVRGRAALDAEDALAEVTICPAQRWDDAARRIVNFPDQAVAFAKERWPAKDGSRWALVLLDLRFTFGSLNPFGDPEEATALGEETILPMLRAELGEDLPIVILSSAEREDANARLRELGALDFIHRVPGAGAPTGQSRRALAEALFVHGLFPDSHGLVSGRSLAILKVLRQLRRASRTSATVLLHGETGTGKGLLARYLHACSSRGKHPFEVFNASGRNAELQADELFGHWRGAFTDAHAEAPGIWERTNGGTLLIDEVADLTPDVQLRLMQPIEERRIQRLGTPPKGEARTRPVDVQVVLATNRALDEIHAIKSDFLNRIDAFLVDIPPLRDHKEDIPLLIPKLAHALQPDWKGRFLPSALRSLVGHDWRSGNVRELRNVIERAMTNHPDQDITARDLGLRRPDPAESPSTLSGHMPAPAMASSGLLLDYLNRDPDDLPVKEVQALVEQSSGGLVNLVAHSMVFALRLTRDPQGRINLTRAARFLIGRETISPLQAKQLFRRLLSLDRRGNQMGLLLHNLNEPIATALAERIDSLGKGGAR